MSLQISGHYSSTKAADGSVTGTFTEHKTIIEKMTNAALSIVNPGMAVTGQTALIKTGLELVLGNGLAVHSLTGKVGVSAFGQSFVRGA